MLINLTGTAANTVTKSNDKNNGGGQVIYVGGTFGGAEVTVGFVYEGNDTFYPIPSLTAYTADFMIDVDFGAGMRPALSIANATAPTDVDFIVGRNS